VKEIYSRLDAALLQVVVHKVDLRASTGRIDVSDDDEPLQVAFYPVMGSHRFDPHIHIPNERHTDATQEVMIVVEGSLIMEHFDTDGAPLGKTELGPGDCGITYRGGHTYKGLSPRTVVYEIKSGPYKGFDADKVLIAESAPEPTVIKPLSFGAHGSGKTRDV
jgi:mannose-6-phosphate isomerase-like protein (cupin superfamily)